MSYLADLIPSVTGMVCAWHAVVWDESVKSNYLQGVCKLLQSSYQYKQHCQ
jgi:hypothetical protein